MPKVKQEERDALSLLEQLNLKKKELDDLLLEKSKLMIKKTHLISQCKKEIARLLTKIK